MTAAEPRIIHRARSRQPLVPCEPADRTPGCGELTPFQIKGTCTHCGQRQDRAHAPEPPPGADVIDGDVLVVDSESGAVVAAQLVAVEELADRILEALNGLEYWIRGSVSGNPRLSGIGVTNLVYGTTAPQPMRMRYGCQTSRFDERHPNISAMIYEGMRVGLALLEVHAPEAHKVTMDAVTGRLSPTWRMEGLPWTSGVINKTSALPYHRDQGNIPGTWSAMLGARRQTAGGHLHLADYDVWLGIPHGSVCIFDGQSVVHGVSPIHATGPGAVRYTMVAYCKSSIAKCCDDRSEEARRAARLATEADERKAAVIMAQRAANAEA